MFKAELTGFLDRNHLRDYNERRTELWCVTLILSCRQSGKIYSKQFTVLLFYLLFSDDGRQ